jgi:hypothetical protein
MNNISIEQQKDLCYSMSTGMNSRQVNKAIGIDYGSASFEYVKKISASIPEGVRNQRTKIQRQVRISGVIA